MEISEVWGLGVRERSGSNAALFRSDHRSIDSPAELPVVGQETSLLSREIYKVISTLDGNEEGQGQEGQGQEGQGQEEGRDGYIHENENDREHEHESSLANSGINSSSHGLLYSSPSSTFSSEYANDRDDARHGHAVRAHTYTDTYTYVSTHEEEGQEGGIYMPSNAHAPSSSLNPLLTSNCTPTGTIKSISSTSSTSSGSGIANTGTNTTTSTNTSSINGNNTAADGFWSVWTTTIAWFCMILAILSGSTIGPAFKIMEVLHIDPILAACWRCQCMVLILAPIAWLEWKILLRNETSTSSNGNAIDAVSGSVPVPVPVRISQISWMLPPPLPQNTDNQHLHLYPHKRPIIMYLLFASLGWAGNLLCWVSALQYTTTVRASIATGLHPVFLVIYISFFSSINVQKLEWLGVIISVCGLSLTIFDEDPLATNIERKLEFLGLFLCVLGSVFEVFVLVNREVIGKLIPTMLYSLLTTIGVVIVSSIILVFFHSTPLDFTDHGLFGWCTARWAEKMFFFGFVVGVICVAGFNFAQCYISTLVFSACLLIDPAVTGVISWLIGLEDIPGTFTTIGGVIVIGGVACIMIGEHQRKLLDEKEEKEEEEEEEEQGKVVAFRDMVTDGRSSSSSNTGISMVSRLAAVVDGRTMMKSQGTKASKLGAEGFYAIATEEDDFEYGCE